MTLESINKIIEEEFRNYQSARDNFDDIVTWAERLKEIISVHNISDLFEPMEYNELLHITGNSFVISIILAMERHYLFSFAISRIGIESIINMSIIESNYEKHLNIWKKYNECNQDSAEWRTVYKDFNDAFKFKKKKHDYSKFVNDNDMKYIMERWKFISNYGSHSNMMQSAFSTYFSNNQAEIKMTYSLFDGDPKNTFSSGKIVLFIIDIYFVLAKVYSKIFQLHNIDLIKSHDRILELFSEWIIFRDNKLIEFKNKSNGV
jgi:hypothetical protein